MLGTRLFEWHEHRDFQQVADQGFQTVKTRRRIAFVTAAALIAALAGCQQAKAPAPAETGAEAIGPDAKPGMSASEGRLVLPVIAERPAVVYFTLRNDGSAPVTLAGVHVSGAGKAEMHKTEGGAMSPVDAVELAPGATIAFAPGGYHVMAFDLADTLKAGGAAELTLTFSDGDKLSMPLRIETMGGEGHDMSGMRH